jgi:hypothetical protein
MAAERGRVGCRRTSLFGKKTPEDGWELVFPNYRAKSNGCAGLKLPALSPMAMGPFDTGHPGLPPARSLENAFQFRKVFADELGPAALNGERAVLPIFYERLRAAHTDPAPHRHKRRRVKPLFALYAGADGRELRLGYIESREFYCSWYEGFVCGRFGDGRATCAFAHCLAALDAGRSLLICGFDGNDWQAAPALPGATDADKLEALYLSPDRPFGHELVLATLLRYPDQPELWPWRRHARHIAHAPVDLRAAAAPFAGLDPE